MTPDFKVKYETEKQLSEAFFQLESDFYINAKDNSTFELKCRDPQNYQQAESRIATTQPMYAAKVAKSTNPIASYAQLMKPTLSRKIVARSADVYGTEVGALIDMYNTVLSVLAFFAVQNYVFFLLEFPTYTKLAFAVVFGAQLSATLVNKYSRVYNEVAVYNSDIQQTKLEFNLLSFPFFLVFLLLMALVVILEVICRQMYTGHSKQLLSLVPIGAGFVLNAVAKKFYKKLSIKHGEEMVLGSTQRKTVFNMFLAYSPIFLTVFFYYPAEQYFKDFYNYSTSFINVTSQFQLSASRVADQSKYFVLQQPVVSTALVFGPKFLISVFLKPKSKPVFCIQDEILFILTGIGYTTIFASVWKYAPIIMLVFMLIRRGVTVNFLERYGNVGVGQSRSRFTAVVIANGWIAVSLAGLAAYTSTYGLKTAGFYAFLAQNLGVLIFVFFHSIYPVSRVCYYDAKHEDEPAGPEWASATTKTRTSLSKVAN